MKYITHVLFAFKKREEVSIPVMKIAEMLAG